MKSLDDELFDVLLRHAAAQVGREQEEEAERMFEECDRPVDFPLTPAYRRERRRALRRVRRLERPPAHRARRAAAMVALALTGFGILSLSVEAIRNRVFEFFLQDRGTHTEISFAPNEAEVILRGSSQAARFSYPAWLPEGYVLEESVLDDTMYCLSYRKGEGTLFISQDLIDSEAFTAIDTEDAIATPMEIRGMEAVFYEKERGSTLIYHDDEMLTTLIGNQISRKEFVKIAENMEMLKNAEK